MIFDKQPKRKFVVRSVSLKRDLSERIDKLKKELKIQSLSPIINQLIKDWLDENYPEKKEDKPMQVKGATFLPGDNFARESFITKNMGVKE